MRIFQTIITFLDIAAPLVALYIFVWHRVRQSVGAVYVAVFLLLQLVLNSAAKYMMFNKMHNAVVYQTNCILSIIILTVYFLHTYKLYFTHTFYRILQILFLLATFVLIIILITEDISLFNSRSYSFLAFVISFLTLIYYYHKLMFPSIEKIIASKDFWFITGLFAYYTGSFFIFSTYKSFIEQGLLQMQILWSMHNVLVLIMCIAFSIGFSCRFQKT